MLGLLMIAVIIVITDITTTSDQNYYMLKEISEASMMESVDYAYYRKYGDLRINSEKFMENFIRRYAEVVTINKTSRLSFYDIYESPPKVTVEISTKSTQILINADSTMFDITNRLDAILEMYEKVDPTPYN